MIEELDRLREIKVEIERKIASDIGKRIEEFRQRTNITPERLSVDIHPVYTLGFSRPIDFTIQVEMPVSV